MNEAFHLAQLQKVDTQLDQIQARLAAIDLELSSNDTLKQAQTADELAQQQVQKSQRNLRSAEDAVSAIRIKIETSESSLYGGKIKNPKELQDLQHEIQALKRRLSELEDQELESMLALESSENTQKEKDQLLLKTQAEVSSQSAGLLGEQTQLNRSRERLLTERNAILPQISAEYLAIYHRLREQKRGLAVCQVQDGSCTACGTVLRPAEWQAARSPSQVVRCTTCGRILYAG
jgi:predicted  nucleic acid-binding Zn-ribbon protein